MGLPGRIGRISYGCSSVVGLCYSGLLSVSLAGVKKPTTTSGVEKFKIYLPKQYNECIELFFLKVPDQSYLTFQANTETLPYTFFHQVN